jgi:hypothetical protein
MTSSTQPPHCAASYRGNRPGMHAPARPGVKLEARRPVPSGHGDGMSMRSKRSAAVVRSPDCASCRPFRSVITVTAAKLLEASSSLALHCCRTALHVAATHPLNEKCTQARSLKILLLHMHRVGRSEEALAPTVRCQWDRTAQVPWCVKKTRGAEVSVETVVQSPYAAFVLYIGDQSRQGLRSTTTGYALPKIAHN